MGKSILVASRATAGQAPQCIECGAEAHFIEWNASWRSSCKHVMADLVTMERLELEVQWAQEALQKAQTRLDGFRATIVKRSSEGAE